LDGYGKEKLKEVIVKYNVKAPETGNDVIDKIICLSYLIPNHSI
jgi:hypothetical protein